MPNPQGQRIREEVRFLFDEDYDKHLWVQDVGSIRPVSHEDEKQASYFRTVSTLLWVAIDQKYRRGSKRRK